jgi:hypothetical protein
MPNSPITSPPKYFGLDRSPLATAFTDKLLGAFAITDNPQTTASTDYFLGAFGLTDNLERRVQRLDAEPANGEVQRLSINLNARQHEDQQSVATQCWGASSHSTKTVSRNSTNSLCNNAIDEPIDNGANNTRNYRVNGKNERTRLSALTARGCPTVAFSGGK